MKGDDASRLADQAAFGPTPALVAQISQQGSAWIDAQIQTPGDRLSELGGREPECRDRLPVDPSGGNTCVRDNYSAFPIRRVFFQNALSGPDQLRQRVALAYSQIFVVLFGSDRAGLRAARVPADAARRRFRQFPADPAARHAQSVMGAYLNMATTTRAIRPRASRPTRTMHAK